MVGNHVDIAVIERFCLLGDYVMIFASEDTVLKLLVTWANWNNTDCALAHILASLFSNLNKPECWEGLEPESAVSQPSSLLPQHS